jgi:Domain of unknown function (DUF3474)
MLRQQGKGGRATGGNKLDKLEDAALRKWAKAYGLKNPEASREELLRELAPMAGGILDTDRPAANLPLEKPTFTLKDIRDAIPPHCFKRNLWTSLSHLFSDLAIIATFFYLATWISNPALPVWSQYVLWPLYWYAQVSDGSSQGGATGSCRDEVTN